MDVVEVRCRIDDAEHAQRIVDHVVRERFAACGHVQSPATSRYWWRGDLVHDVEVEVVCVTAPEQLDRLLEVLRRLHPYEIPGLLWHTVTTTSDYASWVRAETAQRA